MKARYFSGVVDEEGNFKPHSYEEKALGLHLKSLAGKQCKMIISREFGIRSNQQNKYLWSVPYAMIAEQMGEDDPMVVHYQMTLMFWYEMVEIMGEDGKKTLVRKPKETSGMTTTEFEEYAEKIRRWALDFFGLKIPLPNELIQEE